MTNTFEQAARNRKAFALVTYLREQRASASNVEHFDAQCWQYAALAANVKPPSIETQAMVLETLRSMEAADAHDAAMSADARADADRELGYQFGMGDE
jgi:hypothetical protein